MMSKQDIFLLGFFLALLFLCVAMGGFLLFRQWSSLDSSIDYSSTLVAILTQESAKDDVATRVALELAKLTPQPVQGEEVPDPVEKTLEPTLTISTFEGYLKYLTQQGDTLEAIEKRFQTQRERIITYSTYQEEGILPIDTLLWIPENDVSPASMTKLLPDSAIVNGPLDAGFDLTGFVKGADGFLNTYQEEVRGEWMTGVEIVERVSLEHSISPKLLLAVLEFQSGWVLSKDSGMQYDDFPIGYGLDCCKGLYEELYIVARQFGLGYYSWRAGSAIAVKFSNGEILALDPTLNAGTAALAKLMSTLYTPETWQAVMSKESGFAVLYRQMYGNPWLAIEQLPPLLPNELAQPEMELPFLRGEDYYLTSGPHKAWGIGSPWAAIDFAPADMIKGCTVSPYWITASANGMVVRAEDGVVVIDLDQDGFEQTGWVLFYLHVSSQDRVPVGTIAAVDDYLGHASCEGGHATGSHVHLARKYNGEWILAGGPLPMILSGWVVHADRAEFGGYLQKDDQFIFAYPYSIANSLVER
ncbi:MAG: hypothetical protein K8R40_01605 [Anaerolineaceae bacterium]|nr:hypothetical protein [Anaerolineaceae bacterium]